VSDRIKGLYIAFEEDVHEDRIEEFIKAFKMIKNVSEVKAFVSDHTDWIAQSVAKRDMREKFWKFYQSLDE